MQVLCTHVWFKGNMTEKKKKDSQELASHSPLGLNLTEETALVWPANVNFRL